MTFEEPVGLYPPASMVIVISGIVVSTIRCCAIEIWSYCCGIAVMVFQNGHYFTMMLLILAVQQLQSLAFWLDRMFHHIFGYDLRPALFHLRRLRPWFSSCADKVCRGDVAMACQNDHCLSVLLHTLAVQLLAWPFGLP